jgi:hypothetical protein
METQEPGLPSAFNKEKEWKTITLFQILEIPQVGKANIKSPTLALASCLERAAVSQHREE